MPDSESSTLSSTSLLLEGARDLLGFGLSSLQLDQFAVYQNDLLAWNERMNLTSIVDPVEVQIKHFLDSLSFILAFPPEACQGAGTERRNGRVWSVVDVGSGAGFPGIPLKIACPGLRVTCVDSVGKKTSFVQHVVEKLGLQGVEVITARAEDLARKPPHRERYDLVVSRAVAELRVLAEYCLPFARVGGTFIAAKQTGIDAEIAAAQRAAEVLGGKIDSLVPVDLPGLVGQRQLVVVRKKRNTPATYPRRAGTPQRQPI